MTDNITSFRDLFSVTDDHAYFRHPAVGALPDRTAEAIRELVVDMNRNGCRNEKQWRRRIRKTRRNAAELIGTDPARIGFVSSTSHGLSWLAESLSLSSGDAVLVPDCEFPANQFPWEHLKRRGVEFHTIDTDDGTFTPEDVGRALDSSTEVLSLSAVQFHNGFRADLQSIGELCRERDVVFVVDAIQSLGWDSIDVNECEIDALVADGHKWLCAPEGAGLLYLSEELQTRLDPALVGWHSVTERYEFEEPIFDLRSDAAVVEMGSQNTIGLTGLGVSLSILLEVGLKRIQDEINTLRSVFTDQLLERGFRCRHRSWPEDNRSAIVALNHPDLPEEGIVHSFEEQGVQLTRRGDNLRVGLHFYNNRQDVGRLLDLLDDVVGRGSR